MVQSSKHSKKLDPFKNFKFRVIWDNRIVAGVTNVSGQKRTTEVVEWREGGKNFIVTTGTKRTIFGPLTLKRLLIRDYPFLKWLCRLSKDPGHSLRNLSNLKKDLLLVLVSERKERMILKLNRAWIRKIKPVPELDAGKGGGDVAMEELTLSHEGLSLGVDCDE